MNKQSNPVMVNLDRIVVSTDWEAKFPKCFAWSKTRVGSDHWLIILDTWENSSCRQKFLYFEKQWLLEDDFSSKFGLNWKLVRKRFSGQRYSMDVWNGCLSMSRQYLKGWAANRIGQTRKTKSEILGKLEELDRSCETQGACELWEQRYQLENNLDQIYQKEEMYWQQRGSEKWLLEADANTAFFHSCANGRRRKTRICALETESGTITEQKELEMHIVNFYKQLFGSSRHKGVHLSRTFWPLEHKMGDEDRRKLEEPFTERDAALAISGIKIDSAPGPNGILVIFFKKLWLYIKQEILRMVLDF
jgi:hypothetical protein